MYFARKRLDTDPLTLLRSLLRCLIPLPGAALARRIDARWGGREESIACLSVRSAFDLLLQCVDWPEGSEVAMTAVTIPHMASLVRAHGYVPVAVDLDLHTMTPTVPMLRAALTQRTRAVVIAPLFGARGDIAELANLAREHGVMVIEDCAQCYDPHLMASRGADVELYSFGTIKSCTCFGGAVARVATPSLREAIVARQAEYPQQSTLRYARKLLRYLLLTAVSGPRTYSVFVCALRRMSDDYDRVIRALTRGFDDDELLQQIRHRPCPGLLATLAHRLETYDGSRLRDRARAAAIVAAQLEGMSCHLGGCGASHTHWLFPIVAADPDALVSAARGLGFDATTGASTLVAIEGASAALADAMARIVYLPVYAGIPHERLAALAGLVRATPSRLGRPGPRRQYRC